MTETIAPSDDELAEHTQALPAELYNRILDLVIFVPPGTGIVQLDKKYKPPVGLQISRACRAAVSQQYYTESVFVDPDCGLTFGGVHRQWLASLTTATQRLIEQLRLQLRPQSNIAISLIALRYCLAKLAAQQIAVNRSAVSVYAGPIIAERTASSKSWLNEDQCLQHIEAESPNGAIRRACAHSFANAMVEELMEKWQHD